MTSTLCRIEVQQGNNIATIAEATAILASAISTTDVKKSDFVPGHCGFQLNIHTMPSGSLSSSYQFGIVVLWCHLPASRLSGINAYIYHSYEEIRYYMFDKDSCRLLWNPI